MTILLETFLFWYKPLWLSNFLFFGKQETNYDEERDEEDDEDEESDENEDDLEERFFG